MKKYSSKRAKKANSAIGHRTVFVIKNVKRFSKSKPGRNNTFFNPSLVGFWV
jgi:hypothetical protein